MNSKESTGALDERPPVAAVVEDQSQQNTKSPEVKPDPEPPNLEKLNLTKIASQFSKDSHFAEDLSDKESPCDVNPKSALAATYAEKV